MSRGLSLQCLMNKVLLLFAYYQEKQCCMNSFFGAGLRAKVAVWYEQRFVVAVLKNKRSHNKQRYVVVYLL